MGHPTKRIMPHVHGLTATVPSAREAPCLHDKELEERSQEPDPMTKKKRERKKKTWQGIRMPTLYGVPFVLKRLLTRNVLA